MTVETALQHRAMPTGNDGAIAGCVRSDRECRALASEYLTEVIGSPPDDLRWDDTHRLQGHGHVQGRELVVIAPRDDHHRTVVLTVEDWDAVRRSSDAERRALLDACAIADHERLVRVLGGACGAAGEVLVAA